MLLLGMLAAGLTVGGLLTLALGTRPWIGVAALSLAGALATFAAGYHVLTLRMRKISLRRLLRRER
jgi:ubiquinone biosynthesis protein